MTILNDRQIRELARDGMISPFVDEQVKGGSISYGLSSYGYDIRVANEFKVFHPQPGVVIDPKNFDTGSLISYTGDICIIPPNSFALAKTVERFRIPRDVVTICVGKSTYARCAVFPVVTPFEPEWEGHATLEISNLSPVPVMIYANEGIAQLLFFRGEPCEVSYADRSGKYNHQPNEIVTARI